MNFQAILQRSVFTMANNGARVSPFSSVVVDAVKKLQVDKPLDGTFINSPERYPESLADKSFDNTGLLLEAPYRPGKLQLLSLFESLLLTLRFRRPASKLRPLIHRPHQSCS